MGSTQKQRLRAKTGCLTCRSRRKKCDEQLPVCGLCSASKRDCSWPTSADLLDRRYASHTRSRHSATAKSPSSSSQRGQSVHVGVPATTAAEEVVRRPSWPHAVTLRISLPSESMARRGLSLDLELAISRHFVEKFYGLLLLPNCHPDFYDGWITDIQILMLRHESLRYSVLANGASHLHLIDENDTMQELALTYYSNALRDLSKVLAMEARVENNNGLLMSVMLLYLHGCMGRGTYTDIPKHVSAAIRILTMRCLSAQPSITRAFDRLAFESVLYQMFLTTTGLWSENVPPDYGQFWVQAENLLDRSTIFPGGSNSLNSPVLGVPVSLFRLALSLKQGFQRAKGSSGCDMVALAGLKDEVEAWEALVLCNQNIDQLSASEKMTHTHKFYRDASYLYVLICSLLLEQAETIFRVPGSLIETSGLPEMASTSCWQIVKVAQILRSHQDDKEWKMCFIGNWPMYTLGFFMSTHEHVQLVRADMNDRWKLTKFAQVQRFGRDLEKVWSKRGFGVVGKAALDCLSV